MKNKFLPLLVFIGMGSTGFAQVNWEIKAGLTYSKIVVKETNGAYSNTSLVPGPYAGMGVSIGLTDLMSLQPSIMYARRGFKTSRSSGMLRWSEDLDVQSTYLELPFDFTLMPRLGPGRMLIALGPYISHGSGGRWSSKQDATIDDIYVGTKGKVVFHEDNSYANDETTLVYARPWDYGGHFRVGYAVYSQYVISFEMQEGLANLQPALRDRSAEGSIRNRSFAISLAARF